MSTFNKKLIDLCRVKHSSLSLTGNAILFPQEHIRLKSVQTKTLSADGTHQTTTYEPIEEDKDITLYWTNTDADTTQIVLDGLYYEGYMNKVENPIDHNYRAFVTGDPRIFQLEYEWWGVECKLVKLYVTSICPPKESATHST